MESVEWSGLAGAWDYTTKLRVVVSRLAEIRVRQCHQHTLDSITSHTAQIHASVPLELEVTHSESKFGAVKIDLHGFESGDQFDILRSFVPGAGMLVVGLASWRSCISGVLRPVGGKVGKLVFMSVAFAGNVFIYPRFRHSLLQNSWVERTYQGNTC